MSTFKFWRSVSDYLITRQNLHYVSLTLFRLNEIINNGNQPGSPVVDLFLFVDFQKKLYNINNKIIGFPPIKLANYSTEYKQMFLNL